MSKVNFIFFIFSILLSSIGYASCTEVTPNIEYKRNDYAVSSYIIESENLTASYFTCVLINNIFANSSNFNKNFIINLTNYSHNRGLILKVSQSNDLFILVDFKKVKTNEYKFTAVTYPQPLKRLEDILQNKKFPTLKELKLHKQDKYKVVQGLSTESQIMELLGYD